MLRVKSGRNVKLIVSLNMEIDVMVTVINYHKLTKKNVGMTRVIPSRSAQLTARAEMRETKGPSPLYFLHMVWRARGAAHGLFKHAFHVAIKH